MIYLDPDRQGSGTDNWRWRASDHGRQVAGGGNWEPRDSDGYLRRLRSFRQPIDEGALLYVEEALRAFRARCYLATSVMLGVAVESVFNGLAEAFVTAIPEKTTSLRKALNNPRASQNTRFEELRKALEPIRPQLPDGLADRVTLDAVADLLRTARNDAGHPAGKSIRGTRALLGCLAAAGRARRFWRRARTRTCVRSGLRIGTGSQTRCGSAETAWSSPAARFWSQRACLHWSQWTVAGSGSAP